MGDLILVGLLAALLYWLAFSHGRYVGTVETRAAIDAARSEGV